MTRWVRYLPHNPNSLSLIPGAHTVGGRGPSPPESCSLNIHNCMCCVLCVPILTHTNVLCVPILTHTNVLCVPILTHTNVLCVPILTHTSNNRNNAKWVVLEGHNKGSHLDSFPNLLFMYILVSGIWTRQLVGVLCVMACVCLAQGVAYLEMWPCWSRCVTVGVGFNTLVLAAWKSVFH